MGHLKLRIKNNLSDKQKKVLLKHFESLYDERTGELKRYEMKGIEICTEIIMDNKLKTVTFYFVGEYDLEWVIYMIAEWCKLGIVDNGKIENLKILDNKANGDEI